MELRQIVDLAPQFVVVYGPRRDRLIYANRILLDYLGVTLEGLQLRFNRSHRPTALSSFILMTGSGMTEMLIVLSPWRCLRVGDASAQK